MTSKGLYEPVRHVVVNASAWDEDLARSAIDDAISTVVGAQQDDGLWPLEGNAAVLNLSLYLGTAGILWGLDDLEARGLQSVQAGARAVDLSAVNPNWQGYESIFNFFDVPRSHSFFMGPVGTTLLTWKKTQDPSLLDQLDRWIGDNEDHPWMENFFGVPSTMLAANHIFGATGDQRFAEHIRSGARYLEKQLQDCEERDCRLWNINLYGESSMLLGAGHGFVGNAFPILKGKEHLFSSDFERWREIIIDTALKTADREHGLVNWPQSVGKPREGRGASLVQQCHGAPGFVIGLVSLMGSGSEEFDELMCHAAETTWAAGPLAKYPGLCHGTPGNGYAFLKMFEKTGDELWLERARSFAMMAIEQRKTAFDSDGTAICSLWEGDIGFALYLADCIDISSDFPCLDYF